jgi:REP element-mobilizing transposase RayT
MNPGSLNPMSKLVSGLHSRGALPHLKREGAFYFVTFRLSNTLPSELLRQLQRERQCITQQAEAQGRPLTWQEQKQLFHHYTEKVDQHLNAGNGDCWLLRPAIALLVVEALRHFDRQRYTLAAWVIMPNHVHAVVRPHLPHTLSGIMHSWKGYTAHQANRLLARPGLCFWQNESYDHLCRDEMDQSLCCAYTINNPVAAKLCTLPGDWPWSSVHDSGRSC